MNGGTPAPETATSLTPAILLLDALIATKHRLGLLCTYWAARSPGLEMNMALANMAQEEEGHALVLETLLHEDYGRPAPDRDALVSWDNWPGVEPGQAAVPQDWPTALAELLWLDALATAVLQALTYWPGQRLVDRARKMLQEEAFHRLCELETARLLDDPPNGSRWGRLLEDTRQRLARQCGLAPALAALVANGLLPDAALTAHDAYLSALQCELPRGTGNAGDGG